MKPTKIYKSVKTNSLEFMVLKKLNFLAAYKEIKDKIFNKFKIL